MIKNTLMLFTLIFLNSCVKTSVYQEYKDIPQDLKENIARHGRRNISILTNAPTGSVSIMSQTSSGLEPVFRNSYIRRRKLSHNEAELEADFIDELGDKWLEYKVYHHIF